MFTPVSCVFKGAGGQFDNEDDPEQRRPNCPFYLTFQFSAAPSNTAEQLGVHLCAPLKLFPELRLFALCITRSLAQPDGGWWACLSASSSSLALTSSVSPSPCSDRQIKSHLSAWCTWNWNTFLLLIVVCINNLPSAAATTSQSRMSHRCDCCRDDTNGAQTRWIWRDWVLKTTPTLTHSYTHMHTHTHTPQQSLKHLHTCCKSDLKKETYKTCSWQLHFHFRAVLI